MRALSSDAKSKFSLKDGLITGLLLVVVALVYLCGWQRAELQQLAATLNSNPVNSRAEVRSTRARSFALAPADRPAARPALTHEDDPGGVRAGDLAVRFKPGAATENTLGQLLNNPEFFQALQLHRQSAIDAHFGPLFRQLALGADELALFKRLLAEKENVALDVIAVSETQPSGPLPAAALGASVRAARTRVDEAIRAALGADRYSIYSDYEKSLPQRAVVAQLEQRLSYSEAPLTPVQAESLVKILTVHGAPATPAGAAAPNSAVVVANGALASAGVELRTPPAVVSNEALTEAQAVLAPQQIMALRELQSEQMASAQVLQLLRDSLGNWDKATSAAWQLLFQ